MTDVFTSETFENVDETVAVPMKPHQCRVFIAKVVNLAD